MNRMWPAVIPRRRNKRAELLGKLSSRKYRGSHPGTGKSWASQAWADREEERRSRLCLLTHAKEFRQIFQLLWACSLISRILVPSYQLRRRARWQGQNYLLNGRIWCRNGFWPKAKLIRLIFGSLSLALSRIRTGLCERCIKKEDQ